MFLINLHQGIPVNIWYDWKNDGTDPTEREHQFGTVKYDLNPRAAYVGAKVLSSTLAGYSIDQRLNLSNDNDFTFRLTKGKSEAIAFWTVAMKHAVRLPLEPTEATLVGIFGGKVTINWNTENLKRRAKPPVSAHKAKDPMITHCPVPESSNNLGKDNLDVYLAVIQCPLSAAAQ